MPELIREPWESLKCEAQLIGNYLCYHASLKPVPAPIALQYSFSLTTFSPSGKLVQIEYALNAVAAGTTSLGIKATNGVVVATEKKLRSSLVSTCSYCAPK